MTQKLELLAALKRNKSGMTKQEILRECGVYESGYAVQRLREDGHKIETRMFPVICPRTGKKKMIGRYVWGGDK